MTSIKKAFVLGMARSGYEAAKLLAEKGSQVVLNDAKAEQNQDQVNELQARGITVVLGEHPEALFDKSFEVMVKNPGIPNTHPYVAKAREWGIPVINELELACRNFPEGVTLIGITGTNGKTTTTTIIYKFLMEAGKSAYLMGNIGYPVCSFVSQLKAGDIAVMEVSDHQLCNVDAYKTHISVLTNLSEAHLDFHGSYEVYKQTKKRIFNHHSKSDVAILNLDDPEVMSLTRDIASTKRYFASRSANTNGCSIKEGAIFYGEDRIIGLEDIRIKGYHNYENAMAAIAAVKELGVENGPIIRVLKDFGGVEHRMEYVRSVNQVDFYNDSKATNITSTQIALSSFTTPTILLMGGLDRGHSFAELKDYLKHVRMIVSYGETKNRIAEFAAECGIPCKVTDTLEEATLAAYRASAPGYVVLLSPACASWDQFANFEIRGNQFKACVNHLEAAQM